MQDFSKAEVSRNHNTSFKASIKTALEFIDELNQSYQSSREELEVLRKERAAIIENIIQTLKNKKVKISKPLGKCNNFEINEELLKVIEKLDFKEREKFQVDLIKINNRYARITELGKKLEDVSNKLSTLHVPEVDYNDELVIDLNPEKAAVEDNIKTIPIPEVDDTIKAEPIPEPVIEEVKAPETVPEIEPVVEAEDFDDIPVIDELTMAIPIVTEEQINAEPIEEEKVEEPVKEEKKSRKGPNILEETDLYIENRSSGKDESMDIDLGLSDDSIVESALSNYKKEKPVIDEEDDFLFYTITNGVTLEEIAQSVYEDSKLWIDLYKYDSNKGIIDRTAAKLKKTVKEVCTTPGYLDDVKLKFPVELITYEEIVTN